MIASKGEVRDPPASPSATPGLATTVSPENPEASEAVLARVAAAMRTTAAGGDRHPAEIGDYRLEGVIGEGGMGVVYRAEQFRPLRRRVALKLIKPGLTGRDVLARFQGERQALALMDHPHVARVLGAGTSDDGRPYFVMEHVPGEPINAFCDARRLSIRERLDLFVQACHAVQHAHQKAIIHRDLKPSNILVMLQDERPFVKVIDFGVAKALGDGLAGRTLCTENGRLIGTPEFMSPEQAGAGGGGASDVDTRSDVYSLGVVLYELLCGALPFDADRLRSSGPAGIERTLRDVAPPRPSTRLSSLADGEALEVARRRQTQLWELSRALRGELEWIPLKAMRKDREQRYATAADLAQDVCNYLEHKPLHAGPESRAYRLRKFARRNKAPLGVAAAFAVLVVGGTATYLRGLNVEQARTLAALQHAERQEAIAQAVSRFQTDMLASADPGNLLGDKVTVYEALQSAVSELNAGRLHDQPVVEAAVRQTIGSTLRALGRYDDAVASLRRGLDLYRALLPDEHPDVARGLHELARTLGEQGKPHDAEPLARRAVELRRRVLPPGHVDVALGLITHGRALRDSGRLEEAEPLFREALAICRQAGTGEGVNVAWSLSNVAMFLREERRFREAEPLLREAVQVCRRVLPADHPELARNLHFLGIAVAGQERYAEAVAIGEEALAIRRRVLPAGHPDIALSLNLLAACMQELGSHAEAEPLLREAVEIRRRTVPATPALSGSLNNLGRSLVAQGELVEAEAVLREALELKRGQPNSRDLTTNLVNLGNALNGQDRWNEAERAFAEAYAIASGHGFPPAEAARYMAAYGPILVQLGRYEEAEAPLRAAYARLSDTQQFAHPRMRSVLGSLAEMCERTGRPDEAARWRAQLEKLFATTQPTTRPAT